MEQRSGRQSRIHRVDQPGEEHGGADDGKGDLPLDQPEHDQPDTAQQDRQRRCFTQRTANVAEKCLHQPVRGFQLFKSGRCSFRTGSHLGSAQRCGMSHDLRGCKALHGLDPGRHGTRKTDQQRHTGDRRRVERVLPQTAEDLFGNDDRNKGADQTQPPRRRGRQVQGKDHTGEDCTQVFHGLRLFQKQVPQIFKDQTERAAV